MTRPGESGDEKNRPNPTGQIAGWKGILNVLTMTYGDRLGLN